MKQKSKWTTRSCWLKAFKNQEQSSYAVLIKNTFSSLSTKITRQKLWKVLHLDNVLLWSEKVCFSMLRVGLKSRVQWSFVLRLLLVVNTCFNTVIVWFFVFLRWRRKRNTFFSVDTAGFVYLFCGTNVTLTKVPHAMLAPF